MASNRMLLAALSMSAAGFVTLVGYESYTDHAVIPIPGDVPTLGFGTTEGVKLGDKTTPPVALARALRDVQKFEGAIKVCVKVPLYQREYDAFTQLAYNIGTGAFCKPARPGKPPNLIDLLNAEQYEAACARIDAFNKSGGRVVPGLVRRRAAERATCEGVVR